MIGMSRLEFGSLELDKSWAFESVDTKYLTHDIHRYPAKFIPQLARRVIETYSKPYQIVLDPFCGSGTALLEARLSKRNTIGVDINPVAYYVSKVKANPIEPKKIRENWEIFLSKLFGLNKVEPFQIPKRSLEILSS